MYHRSTFVAATVAIIAATSITGVKSSACNGYDSYYNFTCSSGHSINHIWGVHSNRHEDRKYCYGCRSNSRSASHCYQTGYVNTWDQPVAKLCNPDYYIAGVRSYHHNRYEDRRFDYKCCRNTGQCARNCRLFGPANSFDGSMNFQLGTNQVLVGAFSWHHDYYEYVE